LQTLHTKLSKLVHEKEMLIAKLDIEIVEQDYQIAKQKPPAHHGT